MNQNLKQQAIDGVLWSAIQKFGISIISFLSNIVLARLLTADDYGCIGMLAIFLALSNAFIYGGFISALIQKKTANDDDFSTVFYWNLLVSILLYFILFLAAPSIASYYGIDLLCGVLRVQGIILIINGLSAVQTTLLRRDLNFKKLARINIVSSIVSIVLAIILAFKEYGVWALVCQQICYCGLSSIILWVTSSWRPKWFFSFASFRGLFKYGCFLLLADMMNSICDNFQGLIIGKKFSSASMGYYSQAKRLEEVPTQSITQLVAQVTFPIYSKIQDEKEKLRQAVKSSLALMNYINFPLMVLLIVVAKPLLLVLYSEKWIDSIPYFQILCVAGLVNCLQSVNYQVVSASGRSKELFVWNFVKRGVGIILMVLGSLISIKGLLWGMVISFYIIYFVNAGLAFKSTHYSIKEQLLDSFPAFAISVVAGGGAFAIGYVFTNIYLALCVQILLFLIVYLAISKLFKLQEYSEMKQIINRYLAKIKNGGKQ